MTGTAQHTERVVTVLLFTHLYCVYVCRTWWRLALSRGLPTPVHATLQSRSLTIHQVQHHASSTTYTHTETFIHTHCPRSESTCMSSLLPLVSAFYAECPATGVCVLGSLQTKPKFMGLSVSIVNTGTVYITIPKLGEVYSMNIPNAYGR